MLPENALQVISKVGMDSTCAHTAREMWNFFCNKLRLKLIPKMGILDQLAGSKGIHWLYSCDQVYVYSMSYFSSILRSQTILCKVPLNFIPPEKCDSMTLAKSTEVQNSVCSCLFLRFRPTLPGSLPKCLSLQKTHVDCVRVCLLFLNSSKEWLENLSRQLANFSFD